MKTEKAKPKEIPQFIVPDCGKLAYKYLQEYGAFQAEAKPVNIQDFVQNFLELDVRNEKMPLAYIKGMIAYGFMDVYDSINQRVISAEPGTIILNEDLQNDEITWRYVLAHEAGHWILKRERSNTIQSQYACCKSFEEREDVLDSEKMALYFATDPDAESEMMADSIANSILMPASSFLRHSTFLIGKHDFLEPTMYAGEHPVQEQKVIKELAAIYKVPEYAVRNYLYSFGLYAKRKPI